MRITIAVFVSLFLVSCGHVNTLYVPDLPIAAEPKKGVHEVVYLSQKPKNASIRIGTISTRGDGRSDFGDLVEEARKKAAALGGDFILEERSGVDESTIYSPGYTTFEADASENRGRRSGRGLSKAKGYSVGPSVSTVHRPWSEFSVWIYTPSQLGIRFDEGFVVTGFHLNSDAESAGVRLGDRVLGIDGVDVMDQRLVHHRLSIQPNKKVRLTLQRGADRMDCSITALPN